VFATVNDARLWFDVLSPEIVVGHQTLEVRPTIIGVHGGPGIDSTALCNLLSPLADVAQTIRYDQRGHGRSDRGRPEQWTLDTWADDLAGLGAILGLTKPILLGTSFGAHVALACAARHPEMIGAVVAAYGGGRIDEHEVIAAFRRLGGERAAAAAAADFDDPYSGQQEWLDVCWPLVSRSPAGVAHLERMRTLSLQSPEVHAAHARTGLEHQLLPHLQSVSCPVLVIGGRDDPLTPPRALQELADALTGSSQRSLVIVPNAGHTLFTDEPDAAYAAIRDFIQVVS
jgi:pimeloyl-ACP methyl ester carboxylesterase